MLKVRAHTCLRKVGFCRASAIPQDSYSCIQRDHRYIYHPRRSPHFRSHQCLTQKIVHSSLQQYIIYAANIIKGLGLVFLITNRVSKRCFSTGRGIKNREQHRICLNIWYYKKAILLQGLFQVAFLAFQVGRPL